MVNNILDLINPQEIGRELQRARKRKGLTQEDAAKIIEVTRTTMVAIEKGERKVRPEELITLARAYGQTVREILKPRSQTGEMRVQFRGPFVISEEDSKIIDPVIIEFEDLCRNYFEIELVCNTPLNRKYPNEYDISNISMNDRERKSEYIALEERTRLGLGDGPLPNVRALFDNDVGIRIFYMRLPSKFSEIYGYTEELGGCLAISSVHSEERRRWSLVHGYFHFLTTRQISIISKDDKSQQEENERLADAFARYFLMPTSGIIRRFDDLKSVTPGALYSLANYYGVSIQALVRRLEGLKRLPIGMWERMEAVQWNLIANQLGLERVSTPEDKYPARFKYLAVDALLKSLISESQFAKMLEVDILTARQIVDEVSIPTETDLDLNAGED